MRRRPLAVLGLLTALLVPYAPAVTTASAATATPAQIYGA
ncbi:hypothetical protein GCM10010121_031760 [Streptomyces brasiliensis]|uniref:Uncharacterized protein n=1 Tax=Streptomyces brasiliensis TaxID=1954 RepID=A0A917NQ30_9ACTN|nr:hypothetical protein GCM10010121_031760 [Streptomyces brasiliensis]